MTRLDGFPPSRGPKRTLPDRRREKEGAIRPGHLTLLLSDFLSSGRAAIGWAMFVGDTFFIYLKRLSACGMQFSRGGEVSSKTTNSCSRLTRDPLKKTFLVVWRSGGLFGLTVTSDRKRSKRPPPLPNKGKTKKPKNSPKKAFCAQITGGGGEGEMF